MDTDDIIKLFSIQALFILGIWSHGFWVEFVGWEFRDQVFSNFSHIGESQQVAGYESGNQHFGSQINMKSINKRKSLYICQSHQEIESYQFYQTSFMDKEPSIKDETHVPLRQGSEQEISKKDCVQSHSQKGQGPPQKQSNHNRQQDEHNSIPAKEQNPARLKELPDQEWDTVYVDGKFYLSHPDALARLRALDNEIEIQKEKKALINDTEDLGRSYFSHQHYGETDQDQEKKCLTEGNEILMLQKKESAENHLEEQLNDKIKPEPEKEKEKEKDSVVKKQIVSEAKSQKECSLSDKKQAQSEQPKYISNKQLQKNNEEQQMQKSPENDQFAENKKQEKEQKGSSNVHENNSAQNQQNKINNPNEEQNQDLNLPITHQQSGGDGQQAKKQGSNHSEVIHSEKGERINDDASPKKNGEEKSQEEHVQKQKKIIDEEEKKLLQYNFKKIPEKDEVEEQPGENTNENKQKQSFVQEKDNQDSLQKDNSSQKQEEIKSTAKQQRIKSKADEPLDHQKASGSDSIKDSNKNIPQIDNQNSQQQIKQGSAQEVMNLPIQQKEQEQEQKNSKVQEKQKSIKSYRSRSKKSDLLDHIQRSKNSQQKNDLSIGSQKSHKVGEMAHSEIVDRLRGSELSHSSKNKKDQELETPEIKIVENELKKQNQCIELPVDKSVQYSQPQQQTPEKRSDHPLLNYLEEEVNYDQLSDSRKSSKHQPSQKNPKLSSSRKTNKSNKKPAHEDSNISQNKNSSRRELGEEQQAHQIIMEDTKANVNQNDQSALGESRVSKTQKSFVPSVRNAKSEKQQESSRVSEKSAAKKSINEAEAKGNFNKKEALSVQINEKRIDQKSNAEISGSRVSSDKKQKSFIIHSRENSAKKSRRRNPSIQHSQRINPANQKQQQILNEQPSSRMLLDEEKNSKEEIKRLEDQIFHLQEKLRNIEKKQDQMIKFENKQSKQMKEKVPQQVGNEGASPLGKYSLTSRLKLQNRLSFEGSTVHYNTYEEKQKIMAEENEKTEKLKLQQEVERLKKVIRDMQLEKIMSIENDPRTIGSRVEEDQKEFRETQNKSRVMERWKQSLNTDLLETKGNQWQPVLTKKEEVGKIVKNSPAKAFVDLPRKFNRINAEKGKLFSEIAKDDREPEQDPLPLRKKIESTPQKGSARKDLTKSELLNRFDRNQKQFHQFLQSSRMIHEPESYIDQNNQSMPDAFYEHTATQKLFHQSKNEKIPEPIKPVSLEEEQPFKKTFSYLTNQRKNDIEEEDIACQEININDIEFPDLPECPNLMMSQDDLLETAKKAFSIFGIDIDHSQLCMKKYKNCVVFSLENNPSTILWHYNGKFYIGGWKSNDRGEGQKIGQGIQFFPGKHIYRGQFSGGKKNGNGLVKLTNGNIYEGQWVDGVKCGRGVYFEESSGTFYSGEWKDGKRDGYGILKFSQQQFYEGTFARSIKHGFGVERFANGDRYKGEYEKGKFHGEGKYVWANGSSYEGNFVDGCRHGEGSWKSSRNNGDIYIGSYERDKKSGYGRYVWANGCVYEGQFKNDLKNGKGRLVYKDGKEIRGVWENGNLISNQNERKLPQHEESPLRKSTKISNLRQSPRHSNRSYFP